MKRLSLFAYLLLLLQPAFGAEVNKLLYKAVDEESITVINNPQRVVFDQILLWSEMNATIRKEINCKDHTIFIHEIQAAKSLQKPISIKNKDEPSKILLKTDEHYDIYNKYCL